MYPYTVGVSNAFKDLWHEAEKLMVMDKTYEVVKQELNYFIETYVQEKIQNAQKLIVELGKQLISKTKHEQIMVVGTSTIFDELFKQL